MRRSIGKLSSQLYIAYRNESHTNSLHGERFEIIESEKNVVLIVDLEGNLRVKNKSSHRITEAEELIEDHSYLGSIQISNESIKKEIHKTFEKLPNAKWKLRLLLGSGCSPEYGVSLEFSELGCLLHVQNA
ncbi:hypothetical protein QFX18_05225 [Saccharophagus degradans]|uniref:hypothetical protein n=1 Tax=Saccharophagus degradans TaxID=86304 RepID=UPI002477EE28|nr:hypothetical protein [Saccharophagus degradans]WGO99462.1 hypothetical protein QFX18_05225 [Saccharophagus degradans]